MCFTNKTANIFPKLANVTYGYNEFKTIKACSSENKCALSVLLKKFLQTQYFS